MKKEKKYESVAVSYIIDDITQLQNQYEAQTRYAIQFQKRTHIDRKNSKARDWLLFALIVLVGSMWWFR